MGLISNLVVSVGKAATVRDFNIHFVHLQDPLRTAFVSILDLVRVNQNIIGPTHYGRHTTYLPQTSDLAISDHSIISFKMCLTHNICTSPHYHIKHTFTSATAHGFIENLPR